MRAVRLHGCSVAYFRSRSINRLPSSETGAYEVAAVIGIGNAVALRLRHAEEKDADRVSCAGGWIAGPLAMDTFRDRLIDGDNDNGVAAALVPVIFD